ncbi:hypothetical protein [Serinibacter arcticus]|uniref:DUF4261 domain-containing protein n=1 Tax=Serinibacter arcticus TaxID=1655435 RepID=A0A4Z1E2K0_9MICO|nr:hypothetical protein [Serinibacter arcticus]TGO05218.1 hypothetical protein SERN_1222 [Serinibacter arcticus]
MSTSSAPHTVVLLRRVPERIGAVLALFSPDPRTVQDVPGDRVTTTVNGHAITVALTPAPLRSDHLTYALAQSPTKQLLADAVAGHAAHVSFTYEGDDLRGAQPTLTVLTAYVADAEDGLAVFVPATDQLTTDVLYAGEAASTPALTWFNTMAARLDATTSIAHTIGLARLTGSEIQLRSTALSPGEAFRDLREGVAAALDAGAELRAGDGLALGGVHHVLTPGASVIGMGDVLDVVPGPPEAEPRRRGWFRR